MANSMIDRRAMPPAGFPATMAAMTEQQIEHAARHWRNVVEAQLTSDASIRAWEETFLEKLQNYDGTLDAATIVDAARNGHPSAIGALESYIKIAIDNDLFQTLPVSVRDFAPVNRWGAHGRRDYSSNELQVLNDYNRDFAICLLMYRVKTRWPKTPLLYSSKKRRSAAAIIGSVFNLGEARARSIYKARHQQDLRVAEMLARPEKTHKNGPRPIVR